MKLDIEGKYFKIADSFYFELTALEAAALTGLQFVANNLGIVLSVIF